MKSTAIVCAITALSLSFGSLAFAEGRDKRGDRDEYQRHSQQREQNRYERRVDRREDRRDDRRAYQVERKVYRPTYVYNARGPEFRRGGYMPRAYRNQQYYVSNYRAYHLSPPPRGHAWVQVGGDYVLMAVATGIIASIILNH